MSVRVRIFSTEVGAGTLAAGFEGLSQTHALSSAFPRRTWTQPEPSVTSAASVQLFQLWSSTLCGVERAEGRQGKGRVRQDASRLQRSWRAGRPRKAVGFPVGQWECFFSPVSGGLR